MNESTLPQALTGKQKIAQIFIAFISLAIAISLVPAITIAHSWTLVVAFVVIFGLQLFMTPLFALIGRALGVVGLLLISFFGNAFIVWLTFALLPGVQGDGVWSSILCAWLYALIITIVNWMFVSQSNDMFLAFATRSVKQTTPVSKKPGFLFVQLDGVSAPVLDWQLKAGNLPNIARLIKHEDYKFRTWHAQLPSTTPASQAGILLGKNDNIPAFRWYEKSALNGSPRGQFDLASCYQHGKFVAVDKEQAIYWYRQAQASGVARAARNLEELLGDGHG